MRRRALLNLILDEEKAANSKLTNLAVTAMDKYLKRCTGWTRQNRREPKG
jgi:ferritin-like metal-binding protein YciE